MEGEQSLETLQGFLRDRIVQQGPLSLPPMAPANFWENAGG